MRNGIYTVDSIENGLVRLLWQEDETVEEYIAEDKFSHEISEGMLIDVKMASQKVFISKPKHELTKSRRDEMKEKMDRLKKR
ncbi:DUF3006 family protein [Jeotgalibacillus salarius]|uniref:DUF3006 domain-containing protein n=1 Tax=Jeotgalibacillus salarius TaxID=546023 RepID=A0A4Y8LRF7_9BACL|nr:DUF3006 family protein [Jeotgalibacillus salarius]TFE04039.1 DUF3006 domain-containing protein [Jeotgalibacillus salarius]